MLNDVAIEAIETGVERITNEALERYKTELLNATADCHSELNGHGPTITRFGKPPTPASYWPQPR